MFNIDFLITEKIAEMLDKKEKFRDKAEILLKLTEFEENFPGQSEEISALWYENTGERYSSYFLSSDDKDFLLEYAEKIGNFGKVKELMNKLCSINDGVFDYDEIISQASNEINIIADITDFKFSDGKSTEKSTKRPEKTSLDVLLSRKM